MFGFGLEKQLHQGLQALAPLLRQRRLREFLVSDFQRIQQGHQRADQHCIQTADFIIGLNTIAGLTTAYGIAEQHAAQAKTPTVLFQVLGQTKACALLRIQPPANAGAFDPAMQGWQIALLHLETGAQRRHVEQVEDFTDGEAAVRQFEQVLKSNQQRITAALPLVGQGVGNKAPIITFDLPENSPDMRRITVHIRHHHNHIAWLQLRVFAKSCK